MKDERREVTGFFCRWCLLGLAWTGLGAAGYFGVASASPNQESPAVFLSDEVFAAGRSLCAAGRLVPPPKDAADVRLLIRVGDQVSVAAYEDVGVLPLPLDRPAPGDFQTGVIGMPYVFLLFSGDAGTLRIIPADERVFLIDSSLEPSAGGADPVLWALTLAAMRRGGTIAMFHPGPAEAFEAYRRDLRRRGIADPVICDFAAGEGAAASLVDARNTLQSPDRRPGLTTVVTGERKLARAAADMGFSSSWIVPRGAPQAPLDARVKAYASLESFVQSLGAELGGR